VYNGTYYENVIVNKTINLTGEDRDGIIIDGAENGDVIQIFADWVNTSRLGPTDSKSSNLRVP